jgi:hypothetical protein
MRASTEKKITDLTFGLISLLKVALNMSGRENIPEAGAKKQLLILGNGPSLTQSILDQKKLISESELMAVNHLSRSDVFVELKPSVLVLTPIEFWDHAHDVFLKEEFLKTAEPIINNTDWKLSIIAPSTAKHCTEALAYFKQNRNITIYFVNMTPIDGHQGIANWIMKNRLGLPRPHNVLIPSIVIGVNQGYEKIFLVGADHSWIPGVRVTEKNEVVMVQKHFYDEKDAKEKAMYNAKSKGFDRKLHEVLQKFMYAFKSYFIIDAFAKSVGCSIINLTPDSFIDAFDREVK